MTGGPITLLTNKYPQYILSISNLLGCSVWNSYTNAYPRAMDIIGVDNHSMYLSASPDGIAAGTPLTFSEL